MTYTIKVAIAQHAPIPLAVGDGIAALVDHARRAADAGASLVAFGETFLGGYPLWLDSAPGAALWEHPGTKALHAILLEYAVVAGDPRLAPVQELVDRTHLLVSVGVHERVRGSLFNTQLLFRPGKPPLPHRKLVPTHGERLIWARGDGSTLDVHLAPWGSVGALICWEHWMPLARATMHRMGEAVHIAAWPTVQEAYAIAARHYAFEGRCFVLAAGTIQSRGDLIDGLDRVSAPSAARDLVDAMPDGPLQYGGSLIISPDGTVVAAAGAGEELLIATIDLSQVREAHAALDTDGHYARHDIFELRVDRRPQPGIVFQD